MQLKSHRQFVQEQTEDSPEFNREYELAGQRARFAVALAMQRERRGLTQQELSEISGLSQPMLARYENGQIPTVPTLQRLAAALNARVLLLSDAVIFEPLDDMRKKVQA